MADSMSGKFQFIEMGPSAYISVLCFSLLSSCEEKCAKTLTCRHSCPKNCSELCEDVCNLLENRPTSVEIRISLDILERELANAKLPAYLKAIYSNLQSQLIYSCTLRSNYKLIKMRIDYLEPIRKMRDALDTKPKAYASCSTEILESYDERLRICADFIMNSKGSEQQRNDIATETIILKMMADAIVEASSMQLDEIGRKLLKDAFHLLCPGRRSTENIRIQFSRLVFEANKHKVKENSGKKSCIIM